VSSSANRLACQADSEAFNQIAIKREALAIIGMGCRFPGGANDADTYWSILRDGVDALVEIPPDRWDLRMYYDPEPGKPGKTNVKHGGFVKDIDRFDAGFFGISPREATWMDPQQRLLLEVAWEALEDGGQVLEQLSGGPTGIFVGMSSFDYSLIQTGFRDRNPVDVYTNTGGALSIAANRISYCLNFKGPSLVVDTACSSALTAVHLASQSIWKGECDLALAGGVHVLLTPGPYLGFGKLNMLSSDGRCKAFDANANGFVRSEGAGIVVIKPLCRAIADGDRVYALIRGSAINQDGRTTGLTVPSQGAQEEVLRVAYRDAGVAPSRVRYVEAHGTGTLVGDPIEARALGTVLSPGRDEGDYCLLGSVKTNVGHLEAAAGVAGLIKTALALRHRTVPANLHYLEPNPEIPFEALRLKVPCASTLLAGTDGPLVAGVNSFGFGGSNAHVVLEEAPAAAESLCTGPSASGRAELVPLSARSPEALRALARSYREFLATKVSEGDVSLADFCHTARFRRTHHDHRAAIVAQTRAELVERLGQFAAGEASLLCVSDRVVPGKPVHLTFVFSGQGPQWWAMGRQLLDEEPVFRGVIERCADLIAGLGSPWSLLHELSRNEAESRLHETAIAQPAIFAIQAALSELWKSWGVTPAAVVGHSVGEVAAAYCAGALTLEDAVAVIYHRGLSMDSVAGGRMLAIALAADEAAQLVAPYGDRATLAAINSPTSVTLSGEASALDEIASLLESRQVFAKFLHVDYAFHSAQMEPARFALAEALRHINPRPATVPLYSTVTGERANGAELDAEYWWRNVRQPVRFADAVGKLYDQDQNTFLEISPHPVLASAIAECAHALSKPVRAISSLRRNEPERAQMLRSLGVLYALGYPVDWTFQGRSGRFVRIPTYAWQRERYWHESEDSRDWRLGTHHAHPLLGQSLRTPVPSWMTMLGPNWVPYLRDHKVEGQVLVPGAAYLEIALAAAKEAFGTGPYFLEDVKFVKGCFLPKSDSRAVQTFFDPHSSTVQIYTNSMETGAPWVFHASGVVHSRPEECTEPPFSPEAVKNRCQTEFPGSDCYAELKKIGLDYGPTFRAIERLWVGDGEALGELALAEALWPELERYHFHPAALDGCLQVILGTLVGLGQFEEAGRGVYLPVDIESARFYGRPGSRFWSHARLAEVNRQGLTADVQAYDENGRLIVDIRGVRCQYLGLHGGQADSLDDLLYEFQWQLMPRTGLERGDVNLDELPSLRRLAKDASAEIDKLDLLGKKSRFATLGKAINELCAGYVAAAFRELGAAFSPGERFEEDALADELGIAAAHRRLFPRYLAMLAEDGVLKPVPSCAAANGQSAVDWADSSAALWEVASAPAYEPPAKLWLEILNQNPAFFAELTMIARCGQGLAGVLKGTTNPLQLLFPDGSLSNAEHLYSDSPSTRVYNYLTEQAVCSLLEHLPTDRTIRILEIGAGTGGLTSYLLPRLPAGRTEYIFTDLSNHFFVKAGQKFSDFPFVQYKKLDIEKDPAEQEFSRHSFDVIVASQVLHATADLRSTVRHVRSLLAAGGVLILLEVAKASRWIDLVFGLTEGWWRFTDRDLRRDYPLLTFDAWERLLAESGFTETVDVASEAKVEGFGSAVIFSRGPVAVDQPLAEETAPDPTAESGAPQAIAEDAAPQASAESAAAAAPAAVPQPEPHHWLIFADNGGVGAKLAALLESRGELPELVYAAPRSHRESNGQGGMDPKSLEEMTVCLTALKHLGQLPLGGIIHLWNLDATIAESPGEGAFDSAIDLGCLSVINLVRAWTEVANEPAPLWIVTRGAQSAAGQVDFEPISIAQTLAWGTARVLFNEHPNLRCKTIDLSTAAAEGEIGSLFDEIWQRDGEDEVAIRGAARYVHRYVRSSLEKQARGARRKGEAIAGSKGSRAVAYRLEASRLGVLDGLSLREVDRQAPGPHQVEIEVLAAALNFSDVMKALGIYPGLPNGPLPLGIECAGRISAIGQGVGEFALGDEVIALAPFSFGSHATTYAPLVARKPPHLTFEEATTVPIAFLTAHYALNHLARLERGESVLVHAAAGGVGLAAIQLSKRAGAQVFATAGSAEKREFLKSIGVAAPMNSRSLTFADEVMSRTSGRGVDIVLNSLSGEAISKGLSVLAEYGRFLEIGKRDIYMNTPVGLRPFKKNVTFMAVDLDKGLRHKPALFSSLFQEVVRDIATGELAALPHRVFSVDKIVSAFRCMAQAKHIGKIVISMQTRRVNVSPKPVPSITFKPDACYLITGGLGGFGLVVARWMVEHGARNLALLGRRGIHSVEAQEAVDAIRAAGAVVHVAKCDVSDPAQVAATLADVAASMPPLRGIVHAAMALEDSLMTKLDRDRLMNVLGPRVSGTWNLHTQTLGTPLDFFVCFSSMASVFGLPGQTPYVSSNTFLDSFAYYRRSLGLPALTINWGYLGEVGYVARNEKVGERFAGQGLDSFSPREATAVLGQLLSQQSVQVGVVRMDWNRWTGLGVGHAMSPRFSSLCKEGGNGKDGAGGDGTSIRTALLAAPAERRKELLLDFLKDKVARVLGSSADKVDLSKPLTEVGLDSLMAVELRNWVEGELRVSLPIAELLQGPSVDRLAELLLEQLLKADASPAVARADGSTASMAAAEANGSAVTHIDHAVAGKNGQAGENGNGELSTTNYKPPETIDHRDADRLLQRVDELTDDEVALLLAKLEPEASANG
jgi:acyl transferase domain-containing protein/D-arabinose 1-dehydrogenase-like Zn-dependent alcohol dehydrogenase/trans-aconitate methyltransferase/acyl carrier protein